MDNDTIVITTPSMGDIWFDTTTNDTKVYADNSWISVSTMVGDIDLTSLTIEQIEFEDTMPSVAKIEDMCNDYPALDKAYENFKTIYKMVHQDWVGRQKRR